MPKAITSTDLRNLFQNPFNLKAWTTVLKNLFCADEVYDREPEDIETPSDDIEAYSLGWLNTDKYQIALLYYKFTSGSVVRRKVGLRQLANSLARRVHTDAALAVFDDGKHWRLSFICDLKEEKTSPKRYTFVFGDDQHRYHTAVSRFMTLQNSDVSFKTIKEAFSVDAVTKDFYKDLYKWYEWALGLDKDKYPNYKFNVTFPNDTGTANDDREENTLRQHLIRLITRLIFVWFIKQKGLVANELFDVKELKTIIKDFDEFAGRDGKGCKPQKESTTNYYHAILQNLFFATLNNEMGEAKDDNGNVLKDENGKPLDNRRFAYDDSDKSKRTEHYCVKTVYRYGHDLTETGKTKLLKLFARTPFLNGGLFECLDTIKDDEDKKDKEHSAIYCDGFSREFRMNGDNFACRAFIPNVLFFNDDENQPGLITLLNQYNFTVEENSPDEEQVALDPELLGKIFENLLASYNPETAQTARKSTGSYYTPREIVHYMAEQSIAECLKTKLKEQFCHGKKSAKNGMTSEGIEQAIDELMQGESCPESLKLVRSDIEYALLDMKILDPACGSGAFPMGVMQVMLNILSKIKANYDDKRHEYKLKIIQNCLYGVDIQPIAVQIAKLRCFITLIVDETPDLNNPDNLGITVLPNLETKFVCANSLIPLDDALKTPETKQKSLIETWLDKVNKAKKELWDIRGRHFAAKSFHEKKRLRKDDKAKRNELRKHYEDANVSSTEVEKLLSWNPYDQTVSNSFFDPEWMLGVNGGFDVVIGNPPYIKEYTNRSAFDGFRETSPYYIGKMDIWYGFACHGIDMLRDNGVLCFIAQNNWTTSAGAKIMRKKVIENTQILQMIDFNTYMVFEEAGIQTMIMIFKRNSTTDHYPIDYRSITINNEIEDMHAILKKRERNTRYLTPILSRKQYKDKLITFFNNETLLNKIQNNKLYFEDKEITQGIVPNPDVVNNKNIQKISNSTIKVGDGVFVVNKNQFKSLSECELKYIKPLYEPCDMERYILRDNRRCIIYITNSNWKNDAPVILNHLEKYRAIMDERRENLKGARDFMHLHWPRDEKFFKPSPKILSVRKCVNRPVFVYCESESYVMMAINVIQTERWNMKFLTGVLNSKLVAFWLKYKGKMQGTNYQVDKEPLMSIPLPPPNTVPIDMQHSIIDSVERIIQMKSNGSSDLDIVKLEKEIDLVVYKIYKINDDERAVIENVI